MNQLRIVGVFVAAFAGCNQPLPTEPATPPQTTEAQAVTDGERIEAARFHVQQYIDRLMGGDQSVKLGLLGSDGVDFTTIDSLVVTSAVPTYLPDGRKVENMVRVGMSVSGFDSLKRQPIQKNITRDVHWLNDRWTIVGTNL